MSVRILDLPSTSHETERAPDSRAVVVQDLRKTYPGGVEAVKGVSFEVTEGEVFGLVGPNGAGKSTTIGMLTSTVIPESGSARIGGIDVAADPIAARKLSSVVFQEAAVDRGLTGRANILLHARLWGVPMTETRARIDELAASFDLVEIIDRVAATYSGGQRRRLEIARALVSNPRVLFLDEPTVGLDPRIRFELLDLLAGLRDRSGVTVILTTHYLEEAERLCDRVGVMHEGRIVALDAPAALLAELGSEVVEMRVEGDVQSVLRQLRGNVEGTADRTYAIGSTILLPLHGPETASEMLTMIGRLGLPLSALSARRPNLDDVYLRLTAGQSPIAA